MADADKTLKTIDSVFNALAKQQVDSTRAAAKLTDAMDKLSKAGVEKLLDQFKQHLKNTKTFDDEQLKLIKNMRDLTDAVKHHEGVSDKVSKAHQSMMDKLHDSYRKIGAQATKDSGAEHAIKKEYLQTLKDLGVKGHKQAEEIVRSTEALKGLADQAVRSSNSGDRFRKVMEKAGESLTNNITRYISVEKGLGDMQAAVKQGVDEWIKLSRVGLQGTFLQLQTSAIKLGLTFDDFAEIISKHRDMVLQLGGGAEGVQNFAKYLDEASQGLSFLGKVDSRKATAAFASSIQNSGVGINDRSKFDEQMNAMQRQYKDFAKIFGDNYEQYANLVDLQAQDEVIQGRMIGLGRKNLGVVAEEIRARIENEKLLGMSNEQLTDFNKKVNAIIDPENTDLQGQQTGAINAQNAIAMLQRMDPGNDKLNGAATTLQPLIQAMAMGDNDTIRKITSSKEGISAISAINDSKNSVFNRPGSRSIDRLPLNTFLNGSGPFKDLLKSTNPVGMAGLTGTQADANLAKMSKEQLDGLNNSVVAIGAFADSMRTATNTMQQYDATMHNSITKFGVGVGEVILGLIGKEILFSKGGKLLTIAKSLLGLGEAAAAAGAAGAAGAGAAGAGAASTAGRSLLMRGLGLAGGTAAVGLTLGLRSGDLNSNESGYLKSRQSMSANIAEASKITGVDPSVLAAIAGQESGGKSNAKNPNSTATGLFQFTEGTWLDTVKKYGSAAGINTQGMSRAEILNLRNDPRASAIMGAFYIRDGQRATGAQTGGGMYLAHLLGPGGARAVLNANPNTPISQLVDSKAYSSNAKLFDQTRTAGGLLNWANNKIGGKVDTTPITNAVAGMGGDANGSGPTTDSQGNTVLDASQVDGQQTIELQKQTALLAQIASNTGGSRRSIVPESKKAPGTRREISGG
jgi:soluble lytic murein transglycosylase-like protein